MENIGIVAGKQKLLYSNPQPQRCRVVTTTRTSFIIPILLMSLVFVAQPAAYGALCEKNLSFIEDHFNQTSSSINVLDAGLRAGDPLYDNTPKFNALIKNLGSVRTVYFPSGAYYFNSAPKIIEQNITMIGNGINSTSLIRNYTATSYYDVLLYTKRTIKIESIGILAASGTQHGGAIRVEGQAASASVLRDLYITGQNGGTFDIPLTVSSNDELGIRDCNIDNVQLFAATWHLAWFVNVRGLKAKFDAYPAGGSAKHV